MGSNWSEIFNKIFVSGTDQNFPIFGPGQKFSVFFLSWSGPEFQKFLALIGYEKFIKIFGPDRVRKIYKNFWSFSDPKFFKLFDPGPVWSEISSASKIIF